MEKQRMEFDPEKVERFYICDPDPKLLLMTHPPLCAQCRLPKKPKTPQESVN